MFFAVDPEMQSRWWAEHMIGCEPKSAGPFWWLDGVDGVEVGFHAADGRNRPGLTPVSIGRRLAEWRNAYVSSSPPVARGIVAHWRSSPVAGSVR